MLAKTAIPGRAVYRFGPFLLDAAERRLSRDGVEVSLTRKSFDLLLVLVENAGRLQSREGLYATLWPDTIVEEHTLTWHLSALRRALGDTGDAPEYIETVRGHGYRFVAAVQKSEVDEVPAPVSDAGEAAAAKPVMQSDAGSRDASPRTRRWLASAFALLVAVGVAALLAWRQGVRPPGESAGAIVSPRSIAVLPFENLSADPANEYFASGIQETILAQLAGIRDLRVVSRRSTAAYQSRPPDLADVARQLGVGSLLEGNVQKSGAEVMAGVEVRELMFWVPQTGSIGLGLSILSYNGRVHFGVIGDHKRVKDPDAIVQRFDAEFEKLMLVAMMEDWSDDFGAGDAAATLARHTGIAVTIDTIDQAVDAAADGMRETVLTEEPTVHGGG